MKYSSAKGKMLSCRGGLCDFTAHMRYNVAVSGFLVTSRGSLL